MKGSLLWHGSLIMLGTYVLEASVFLKNTRLCHVSVEIFVVLSMHSKLMSSCLPS